MRNEAASSGGKRDGLEPAVVAAFAAGDQLLADEPVDEFGDAAARHAHALGEDAGRGLFVVEHLAHYDPLGHGDSAGQEPAGKGVRDVIGDEAEPEAEVFFEVADGPVGWFGLSHGT